MFLLSKYDREFALTISGICFQNMIEKFVLLFSTFYWVISVGMALLPDVLFWFEAVK